MIWKLLGLQKKLDALFDNGWVSLGLPIERSGQSGGMAVDGLVSQPQV